MADTFYTTEAAAERHKGYTARYFQEACTQGKFPHAFRSPTGRWQIPEEDLNQHFGVPQEEEVKNSKGIRASSNTRIMNE